MNSKLFSAILMAVVFVFSSSAQEAEGKGTPVELLTGQSPTVALQNAGLDWRLFTALHREGPDGPLVGCAEMRHLQPQTLWLAQPIPKVDREVLTKCLAADKATPTPVPAVAEQKVVSTATQEARTSKPEADNSDAPVSTIVMVEGGVEKEVVVPEEVKSGIVALQAALANREEEVARLKAENEELKRKSPNYSVPTPAPTQWPFPTWIMLLSGFALFCAGAVIVIGGITVWRQNHYGTSWTAEPEYWLLPLIENWCRRICQRHKVADKQPLRLFSPEPTRDLRDLALVVGENSVAVEQPKVGTG